MLEKLLWSIDGGKHPEKRSELLLERSSTEIITRPTKTVWFECDDDAKGKKLLLVHLKRESSNKREYDRRRCDCAKLTPSLCYLLPNGPPTTAPLHPDRRRGIDSIESEGIPERLGQLPWTSERLAAGHSP